MHKIVIRPRAEEDLENIWFYTLDQWGSAQADTYLDEIKAAISHLGNNPRLGKSRENVRTGYRSFQINRHVVFYKVATSTIQIVRVLHAHQDPEQNL